MDACLGASGLKFGGVVDVGRFDLKGFPGMGSLTDRLSISTD